MTQEDSLFYYCAIGHSKGIHEWIDELELNNIEIENEKLTVLSNENKGLESFLKHEFTLKYDIDNGFDTVEQVNRIANQVLGDHGVSFLYYLLYNEQIEEGIGEREKMEIMRDNFICLIIPQNQNTKLYQYLIENQVGALNHIEDKKVHEYIALLKTILPLEIEHLVGRHVQEVTDAMPMQFKAQQLN